MLLYRQFKRQQQDLIKKGEINMKNTNTTNRRKNIKATIGAVAAALAIITTVTVFTVSAAPEYANTANLLLVKKLLQARKGQVKQLRRLFQRQLKQTLQLRCSASILRL